MVKNKEMLHLALNSVGFACLKSQWIIWFHISGEYDWIVCARVSVSHRMVWIMYTFWFEQNGKWFECRRMSLVVERCNAVDKYSTQSALAHTPFGSHSFPFRIIPFKSDICIRSHSEKQKCCLFKWENSIIFRVVRLIFICWPILRSFLQSFRVCVWVILLCVEIDWWHWWDGECVISSTFYEHTCDCDGVTHTIFY